MDFFDFFSAYFSDWIGWMSGLVSVILTIWAFLRPKTDSKLVFIIAAAIIAFFVAPIHIWTAEHRARLAEDDKKPDLQLHVVEVDGGIIENKPALVLTVVLRNLGTPSIADHWTLRLNSPVGSNLRIRKLLIPSNGVNLGNVKHIAANDAIADKVIANPIPEGGQQIGVIVFEVDGISEDVLRGETNNLQLSVQDVTGKEVISGPIKSESIGIQYYPGLSHP